MLADPEEPEHDSGQAAHPHGVHESPLVMTIPLILLAILSVIGGWVGVPAALGGSNHFEHFLDPVFGITGITYRGNFIVIPAGQAVPKTAPSEILMALISLAVVAIGFYFAFVLYYRKPGSAAALVAPGKPAHGLYRLLDHKYWVDEIYGIFIIAPLLAVSRLFLGGLVEGGVVQGTGTGLAAGTRGLSFLTRRIQSGNIRSYAGWLAIGAAAVIAIVLFIR
jgi:NADH-quinone oxidoreductase subunit L